MGRKTRSVLTCSDAADSTRRVAIRSGGRVLMFSLLAALGMSCVAKADPIIVGFSFLGSGTVGNTVFTNQDVTLTATGDTTATTSVLSTFFLQPTAVSIGVTGFGTGTYAVNPGTYVFSNVGVDAAGFGQTGSDYVDYFNPVFSLVNLQTSFGPVIGLDPTLTNADIFGTTGLNTSIGLVKVTSEVSGSGTFFAAVTSTSAVPEPRGTTFFGMLLAASLLYIYRRSQGRSF